MGKEGKHNEKGKGKLILYKFHSIRLFPVLLTTSFLPIQSRFEMKPENFKANFAQF